MPSVSRSSIVKLLKKGDLSLCNNWRGITLLSIPSNFLYSVILQRIKTEVGKTLRDEQEGYLLRYAIVFQNFPQYLMVYSVEGFFKTYKIHAERSLPFDYLLYNYSESGNLEKYRKYF
jgi:hypothetical protein